MSDNGERRASSAFKYLVPVARGRTPRQKIPGPPGWGLGMGPITPSRKTLIVPETSTGIRITQPVLSARDTISNGIEMTHYSQIHNGTMQGRTDYSHPGLPPFLGHETLGEPCLRLEELNRLQTKWADTKSINSVTKQALFWNPQGKRNRGRPKNNWRRSAEQELRQIGLRPKLNNKLRTESNGRKLWMTYAPLRNQGTICK